MPRVARRPTFAASVPVAARYEHILHAFRGSGIEGNAPLVLLCYATMRHGSDLAHLWNYNLGPFGVTDARERFYVTDDGRRWVAPVSLRAGARLLADAVRTRPARLLPAVVAGDLDAAGYALAAWDPQTGAPPLVGEVSPTVADALRRGLAEAGLRVTTALQAIEPSPAPMPPLPHVRIGMERVARVTSRATGRFVERVVYEVITGGGNRLLASLTAMLNPSPARLPARIVE